MPRVNKTCEVCGVVFSIKDAPSVRRKNGGRFCSRDCKGVASRQDGRECETCGSLFQPMYGSSKRFCSEGCRRAARKTGQHVSCDYCGTVVYLPRNRLDNYTQHFCSLEHQIAWQGRNKDAYTCKVCGKTFYWSPSRKNQSNATYCSLSCRDVDPDRRAQLIEMNAAQQRGHRTAIERIGYKLLDDMGVHYLPQHVIGGKFCVDAFLPEHGAVVQFDGDYWHGHPEKFPDPDARQRKRMRLDASQDAYMRACGYQVIRLWESDLHSNLDLVRKRLIEQI